MLYDYHCEKCGEEFTLKQTLEEHEKKKAKCPVCGSLKVKRRIDSFFAKTSRKS